MEKIMMMVQPRNERMKVFCRLCRRYDIPVGKQAVHLRDAHGVEGTQHRNLQSIKEFVFSPVKET